MTMDRPDRKALVIIGMHRSGTSALARTLSLLDASLPRTLMQPQPDNPTGFWESSAISGFNEALLNTARRGWDDPKPIADAWFYEARRQDDIAGLVELIDVEYSGANLLVLKDPRISRLLPLWRVAFRQAGITPLYLIMLRNPQEVALSLRSRDPMSLEQAQLLWTTYTLAAERGSRGCQRLIVRYEDLLADWKAALSGLWSHPALEGRLRQKDQVDSIDAFLSPGHRHFSVEASELQEDPRYSGTLKKLYRALQAAAGNNPPDEATVDRVRTDYLQAWSLFSPGGERARFFAQRPVFPWPKQDGLLVSPGRERGEKEVQNTRCLLIHYHLFKNAGSSVDSFLQENFADTWESREGEGGTWPAKEVARFLAENESIRALSSHTAQLPPPDLPDAKVYPILFIRHPIDRIRSIYQFERLQQAETEGAKMAKKLDLREFVRWRLERKGDRSFRNFQTYRLSRAASEAERRSIGELGCAQWVLDQLPFIGLVERFDESVERLFKMLKPYYPNLSYSGKRENVTQQRGTTLEDRLYALQEEVGTELYDELVAENELDMALYRIVCGVYN